MIKRTTRWPSVIGVLLLLATTGSSCSSPRELADEPPPPVEGAPPSEWNDAVESVDEPGDIGGGSGRQGIHEVRVFYGTDRARTGDCAVPADAERTTCLPGRFYRAKRAEGPSMPMEVGSVIVSFPDTHKKGSIERPFAWRKIRFPENPNAHVVLQDVVPASLDDFKDDLRRQDAQEAFVYVHGFSNTFETLHIVPHRSPTTSTTGESRRSIAGPPRAAPQCKLISATAKR